MQNLKVTILTGNVQFGNVLQRYLKYFFKTKIVLANIISFGEGRIYDQSILNSDIWLVEALHDNNFNPEGFRTAYKLAGHTRCLLFFYYVPLEFPKEGPFWCNPLSCRLDQKIVQVLNSSMPAKLDFENLIRLWPDLIFEPNEHELNR